MSDRGLAALPLPVAVLTRRAGNAKSPKERHDTAYYAWEASIRLRAAIAAPDVSKLERPSAGTWIHVSAPSGDSERDRDLVALYGFLTEAGGKRSGKTSVSPKQLLGELAGYRNQVLGHGSVRSNDFYDTASRHLLDGLHAAWNAGIFLPQGAELSFVESMEVGVDGKRRARLMGLSGLASTLQSDSAEIPDEALPGQVWMRHDVRWVSLHPWVLFEGGELRERVLFYNAYKKTPQYLDYVSGELLRGADLDARFPGTSAWFGRRITRGSKATDDSVDRRDPNQFGDYRLLGKLGEGGMGVVYLARQESLGRLVALKLLPPVLSEDPVSVGRFQREIQALSRCDDPSVVKILASGQARDTWYYAMEYIEGADLAQVAAVLPSTVDVTSAVSAASAEVRKSRETLFEDLPDLPPRRASLEEGASDRFRQLGILLRDAARGLDHLHKLGILHRDIKPSNLMITAAEARIVIMDLGLAAVKDASKNLTRDASSVLGTLRYMAPEQLQRNLLTVDHRADVFSLGACFYELATGRALRDGDSEAELVGQILRDHPPAPRTVNSTVPADLSLIIAKAVDPDPHRRYDSSAALADDIEAWLAGQPISARPPTLAYLARLWARRHPALALAAVFTLVFPLVFGVTMSVLYGQSQINLQRALEAEDLATARTEQAERNLRIAESAQLATQAVILNGRHREAAAIRLAVEAFERAEDKTQAREALYSLLTDQHGELLLGTTAALTPNWTFEPWSPDGERFLIADTEVVRLLDGQGQRVAEVDGEPGWFASALWRKDSQGFVTKEDGIRIWDRDGNLVAGPIDLPHSYAWWSDDSEHLLVKTTDIAREDFAVSVFNANGGLRTRVASNGRGPAYNFFAPAGKPRLMIGFPGEFAVYDLDGREVSKARRPGFVSMGASVHPSGAEYTVSWLSRDGSQPPRLEVRDTETGDLLRELEGHPDGVRWTDYSADGRYLAATARAPSRAPPRIFASDGSPPVDLPLECVVRRAWWHPSKNQLLVGCGNGLTGVFEPDGRMVSTMSLPGYDPAPSEIGRPAKDILLAVGWIGNGDRYASLSDNQTFRVMHAERTARVSGTHKAVADSCAWSPDGERLASSSASGIVLLHDRENQLVGDLHPDPPGHPHPESPNAWHAEHSQPLLAWSDDGRLAVYRSTSGLRVFDADGGELFRLDDAGDFAVIAWSPDDRVALMSSTRAELVALDGRPPIPLDGGSGPTGGGATYFNWNRDRDRLLLHSADRNVLWDARGKLLGRFATRFTGGAAWHPDGSRFFVADTFQTNSAKTHFYSKDGVSLGELAGVGRSTWGPDGQILVTDAGADRLTTEEGEPLVTLLHSDRLWKAEWSPDNLWLASNAYDNKVLLWSADGERRGTFENKTGSTLYCWDPRGEFFTTGEGPVLRNWPLQDDALLGLATSLAPQPFSAEDAARYLPHTAR